MLRKLFKFVQVFDVTVEVLSLRHCAAHANVDLFRHCFIVVHFAGNKSDAQGMICGIVRVSLYYS